MRTVEQLRAALRETNNDFRADSEHKKAAFAELAKHGANALEALPEVIAGAGHGHYQVKDAAIATLHEMEPVGVAAGLIAAAGDPATRAETIKALFNLATNHDRPGYLERESRPLVDALREVAVPMLIDALAKEANEYTRAEAVLPLGLYGAGDDRAFAALAKAAKDPVPLIRERTAHGLRYFEGRALPILLALFKDFGGADEAAVYAMSRIATPAAIETLKKFARENKGQTAARARDAAGSIEARAARQSARAAATEALTAKMPAAKKPAAKKATAKPTAQKPGAKKPAAKKATAKPTAKKAAAKRATANPVGKKPTAKPAAKQPSAKKRARK